MPDASGRFRGISIPAVPWHRTPPEPRPEIEPLPCGCVTDRDMVACIGRKVAADEKFGPARQQPGSTPTDTTRE